MCVCVRVRVRVCVCVCEISYPFCDVTMYAVPPTAGHSTCHGLVRATAPSSGDCSQLGITSTTMSARLYTPYLLYSSSPCQYRAPYAGGLVYKPGA